MPKGCKTLGRGPSSVCYLDNWITVNFYKNIEWNLKRKIKTLVKLSKTNPLASGCKIQKEKKLYTINEGIEERRDEETKLSCPLPMDTIDQLLTCSAFRLGFLSMKSVWEPCQQNRYIWSIIPYTFVSSGSGRGTYLLLSFALTHQAGRNTAEEQRSSAVIHLECK